MNSKSKLSLILLISTLLLLLGCSSRNNDQKLKKAGDTLIGVKIYEVDDGRSKEDLFKEWNTLGINTAFVSKELLADQEFRKLARINSIKLFVILPIFYAPEKLEKNPGLYAVTKDGSRAENDWVKFVCPTREEYKQERKDEIVQLIRDFNPDGISLDFIRFFVFWEKVYPDDTLESLPDTCFDDSCLKKFQAEKGIKIPEDLTSVPEIAVWITANHGQEWADWKCSIITGMVGSIAREARQIKPDILINIHMVPWRENDYGGAQRSIAGQDPEALGTLSDYLSPMCYFHMLKRKPSWVNSVVNDLKERSSAKILPSIQVAKAYLDTEVSPADFREALTEALKPPSSGVVFWSWEALEKSPEKKEIVRTFSSIF
jgi:uncharacterized lipoprotein YddW (UPF0748 family)